MVTVAAIWWLTVVGAASRLSFLQTSSSPSTTVPAFLWSPHRHQNLSLSLSLSIFQSKLFSFLLEILSVNWQPVCCLTYAFF